MTSDAINRAAYDAADAIHCANCGRMVHRSNSEPLFPPVVDSVDAGHLCCHDCAKFLRYEHQLQERIRDEDRARVYRLARRADLMANWGLGIVVVGVLAYAAHVLGVFG
jgi:hypothetical protein